ncbi:cation diffusion facilitator family transporter [soil metagenome]
MAHNHHHGHNHSHDNGTGNIKIAFAINLLFTVIEIVGGLFTNSIAILSDALHDLGDSLSLGLSWYFQHKSNQGRDSVYTFGYKRFSLLGAVINSIVLVIGSVFILSEAIPRLWQPQNTEPKGMMILAVVGIIFNGAAVLRLKKGTTINERVVSLHLLEDVLGWIAVLIGGALIYFFGWVWIDPLLSVGITAFILFNVYRNLSDSFRVFLQGKPHGLDIDMLKTDIEKIPLVKDIHDLHIWSMDGEYTVVTLHVVTTSADVAERENLRHEIRTALKSRDINHATIEIHWQNEGCELEDC